MPIEDNVGKSPQTPRKQYAFDIIIRKHIAITHSVMRKWGRKGWDYKSDYLYIDATSGPGAYTYNGGMILGSPLIFLNAIRDFNIKYKAHFIEKCPNNYEALQRKINGDRSIITSRGEYEQLIPALHRNKRATQFGLLYIDPNSGIPDENTIKYVIDTYPKIEILLRYSATNIKRAYWSGKLSELIDTLISLGKRYWLIGCPTYKDQHQWSFLLGTNANVFTDNKFESINLHPKDSEKAHKYFDRLNLTKDDYLSLLQPELPLIHDATIVAYKSYEEYLAHPIYQEQLRRIKRRANGICELCHTNMVTEVHHYQYPEWGTFDLDDAQLVAVCHECHCKLEGKDK